MLEQPSEAEFRAICDSFHQLSPMSESFQEKQLAAIKALEDSFRRGENPSSIVPLMTNPADDERLCLTSMVFLPGNLQDLINEKLIARLKKIDPVQYFYLPDSLHATIQNVRRISAPPAFSEGDIETARAVFRSVCASTIPFTFHVKRLMELPTSISLCAFSSENLQILVQELRRRLAASGLPDDKHYSACGTSFGNVTFCRFSTALKNSMKEAISELKEIEIGEFAVQEIHLVVTNAVCHPKKTRVIETFQLKV